MTTLRDIVPALARWCDAGQAFGLATVVGVSGSAPRAPGAAMAVGPDDEVVGSVSGGCVEGEVFELAREVLRTGRPQVTTYGYSEESAFAVGLTCGGQVTVLVERINAALLPQFGEVLVDLAAGRPVATASVLSGQAPLGARRSVWPDRAVGTLGDSGLDAAVTDDARGMLSAGQTGLRHYGPRGERRVEDVTVFLAAYEPPPQMLVFGAIDYAAALARLGTYLGYRVTVCDARPVFADRKRFPDAHDVVVAWPHHYLAGAVSSGSIDARTVICVLTHDPKFDVPLLEVALRTPAGYVGAMGSRRTHDERLARLRDIGMTEQELDGLHSPIGLDIGARTPEETAVSIAAEIVRSRWGGSGRPLGSTSGPIHTSALSGP